MRPAYPASGRAYTVLGIVPPGLADDLDGRSWLPRRARMMDDEPMGRTERSHYAVAKDASLLLVQDALVQIRAMAYLRREVAAGKDDPPLDYHERIRLIADACENLPGYLRADTPVQGLKHAWTQASEMQQAWIRETLAQHGIAITDLIGQLDQSCNNLPGRAARDA
jgi:hypothetical protein